MKRTEFLKNGIVSVTGLILVKNIDPIIKWENRIAKIIEASYLNIDKWKGIHKKVDDDIVGIAGAISNQTGKFPPPLDADKWTWSGMVTNSSVWGSKVQSGPPYLCKGGLGHLIQGQGRFNGMTYASIPLLFYTSDLKSWESYKQPIIEYSQWQLDGWRNSLHADRSKWGRISPHALVFDDENREFVMYFQSRQELRNGPPGIRNVGVATSKNMIDWNHHDEVWYTVEDWVSDYPGLIHNNDLRSIYSESFPWVVGAWKHNGWYYIIMNGRRSGKNGLSSIRKIMRSRSANYEFEPYEISDFGMFPYAVPIEYDGTWYLPWRRSNSVGLYISDRLEGPYRDFVTLFPSHLGLDEAARVQGFNFFRWEGKWCITYHVNPKGGRPMMMWGMEK